MGSRRSVSIRLREEVEAELRELSRRTRRSLGSVVNELLDLSLRSRKYPGIVFVEGPAGLRAHLAGTGLDVWEVVMLVRSYGSVEGLLQDFPHLPRSKVELALAYARRYPEEVEEWIRENAPDPADIVRSHPWIRPVRV